MLTSQELTVLLREHGYKVTPQRLAVYEALAEEMWHPNAEMLYNKLQPRFPAMSFATVYKTVEILNAIHVIRILNTGEDSYRYDANLTEHHHLRCLKCGSVTDAYGSEAAAQQVLEEVSRRSGYELKFHRFYFYGICPKCQEVH